LLLSANLSFALDVDSALPGQSDFDKVVWNNEPTDQYVRMDYGSFVFVTKIAPNPEVRAAMSQLEKFGSIGSIAVRKAEKRDASGKKIGVIDRFVVVAYRQVGWTSRKKVATLRIDREVDYRPRMADGPAKETITVAKVALIGDDSKDL
jgi:hypothetical protein